MLLRTTNSAICKNTRLSSNEIRLSSQRPHKSVDEVVRVLDSLQDLLLLCDGCVDDGVLDDSL